MTQPFLLWPGEALSSFHSNYWECREIGEIFLRRGYAVDVIDWNNRTFIPKRTYVVCIDIHNNLHRLKNYLGQTKKVFHITGAHWLIANSGEYRRLMNVQERRGVTLLPRRSAEPHFNIEAADYATIFGNAFTRDTYVYAHTPLYPIPISPPSLFEFPAEKNFNESTKHFVWFGGAGMVHKGLDLTLEAFAAMPEYELTVCGPVSQEKDFEQAYWKELYQTPNIKTLGRISITGAQFAEIRKRCGAVILPSCSEGGGGSVINCMHAGLVPIVTPEASVDIGGFGIPIEEPTVAGVQKAVRQFATLPPKEAEERSRKAWEVARATYTQEAFSKEYSAFVDTTIH